MLSSLRRLYTRSLTVPSPSFDARPYARSSVPADHTRPFLRALSPCLLPTARESSGPCPHFFLPPPLSHRTGGPLRRAQPVAPQRLPISLKKACLGEDGAGGKEARLRAGQGSLLPPKPATPALLPALAKAATDFYNHVLAGRPHGTQPCPAARGREGPS